MRLISPREHTEDTEEKWPEPFSACSVCSVRPLFLHRFGSGENAACDQSEGAFDVSFP